MKYDDLKEGMPIEDSVFATAGNPRGEGVIKKILKTRVHVEFTRPGCSPRQKVEVYDIPHLQFLKRSTK